jgi:hypothetical protein
MKKLITLLLLFTLVGFLSGNQVVITNDYEYIVSEGKTYNFNNGSESNNVKYDRTNKIAIQNNKVLADPLKYHYAFFWDEVDTFIGYYKTNKGITTSGEYLGQVNTQSIPLPLNAYSFALVRYDNDYLLVDDLTIEDIFIDSDNYFDNTIEWNALNNRSINNVFVVSNIINNANWLGSANTSLTINGSEITGIGNGTGTELRISQGLFIPISNVIYINYNYKTDIPTPATYLGRYVLSSGTLPFLVTTTNTFTNYVNLSSKNTLSNNALRLDFNVIKNNIPSTEFLAIKDVVLINLTSLGISSLTQTQLDTFYTLFKNINDNNFIYTGYSTDFLNPTYAYDEKLLNLTDIFGAGNEPNEITMDGYYADYEEYLEYLYVCCNLFATQTISFETIYFDDGVSTEIEQLGSILIFTLIGFTLMIFGFASKRRIFNLLAVGAFVVLGFLLIEFVGFIIILFGLIFVNVYYTFFGEL